ncbi:unnamed protein product [Mycena citricolor]|uniref:Uncharacterized protein n=1 Tax=Mycena citricolor TaxID=2018698 RepID=A0AAD2HDS8_9AGAR|nr:unnamed protein product [Mycena citricolor]CAK5282915.1 unnamed protein product [Mycena citricolor]CAK5282928.1 unnamed protein product [Mycena citricolor]
MFPSVVAISLAALLSTAQALPDGVIATGTQGTTNPPVPTMPTTINQNSMARLLSVNSIDDFCIFAPPNPNSVIGNTETEEVAWCTQPRNNARVIPDGVITGLSFLKNDFYVQIYGTGDFTKLNIQPGDYGGELDPHGASGAGNPVGGNVSVPINGVEQPIAEWMMYIDFNQFCLRACTNANSTYSSQYMCWHELDEMGCEYVMPGTYHPPGTFETCDVDVANPPGWYPTSWSNGVPVSFSTFAQYFEGAYTGGDGLPTSYTVGTTVTPTAPFFTPSSSNCVSQATVGNGLAADLVTAGASGTAPPPGFSSQANAPPTSVPISSSSLSSSASASALAAVTPAVSTSTSVSTVLKTTSKSTASVASPTVGGNAGAAAGGAVPVVSSPAAPSVSGTSNARRAAGDNQLIGAAIVSFVALVGSVLLLH